MPTLCQKILRVILSILIIILTEINSISYTIHSGKPSRLNLQYIKTKFDTNVKKSNEAKRSS